MEFLHDNTKTLLDTDGVDDVNLTAKDKDVIVIGGGHAGAVAQKRPLEPNWQFS